MDVRSTGLALIAVACLAVSACSKSGDTNAKGASVGQKIDRALDKTQEKLNAAGEKAQEKIIEAGEKTQQTLSQAGDKLKRTVSDGKGVPGPGGITYGAPPSDTAALDAAKAQQSAPAGTTAAAATSAAAAPGTPPAANAPSSASAPSVTAATSSGPTVETTKAKKSSLADAGITASIKADFLKDPDLSVLKIDVDTVDGVVTLNGLAANDAARTRAGRMAEAVKGVKQVRNFLTIKRA